MNKARLLKLADMLEADARKKRGIKFDMTNWGQVLDRPKPLSCGTVACAFGLAALSGKFKRAGLGASISHYSGTVYFSWKGHGVAALEAASRLFRITFEEATFLFAPERAQLRLYNKGRGARAERQVAAHIRKFVRTGKAA